MVIVVHGWFGSPASRGLDVGRDPVTGAGDPVVDAGLVLFGTGVAGRHDADQVPDAVVVEHERAARVTLTRVPSPNS